MSFVKDWQRAVKELVDSGRLKNAALLLTGSSILDLKFGSEFLSGRRGQLKRAAGQLFWGKTAGGEIDFVGRNQGKTSFFEVKYQRSIDYGSFWVLFRG